MRRTVLLVLALATIVFALELAALADWNPARRMAGLTPPQRGYTVGSERVEVELTIEAIDPTGRSVRGTAVISIRPDPELNRDARPTWEEIQKIKEVTLMLSHREADRITIQGGPIPRLR